MSPSLGVVMILHNLE